MEYPFLPLPPTQRGNWTPANVDDLYKWLEATQPRRGDWTPVLTFATPGDLAVTYTSQRGSYILHGGMVHAIGVIITSAFTHTTAAGELRVTGLPYVSRNVAAASSTGACRFSGITKVGYTQVCAATTQNQSYVVFNASGSAVALASVTAADMPTAGAVTLAFEISYVL